MRICQLPTCGKEFAPNHPEQLYCDIFCKDKAYAQRRRAKARERRITGERGPTTSFVPLADRPMEQIAPGLKALREDRFTVGDGAIEQGRILREFGFPVQGKYDEASEAIPTSTAEIVALHPEDDGEHCPGPNCGKSILGLERTDGFCSDQCMEAFSTANL